MKLFDGTTTFKQARNFRHGRNRPVQLIVLHSMEAKETGSTAANVAAYFAGANAPMASAHFCIDDNKIIQCVRLEDTAYHCKNANANGIGIEHAGYAKQTTSEWLDDYGLQMLELSAKLVASLCHQFNIPVRRAKFAGKNNPQVIESGICGHADVPLHGTHWDPGSGFPWDFYLERVQEHFDSSKPVAKAEDVPSAEQINATQAKALPDVPIAQPEPVSAPANILQSDLLNTPKQIIKDNSGKLANWFVGGSASAVAASIWQNKTVLAVIAFVFLGLTVLAIYFVNKWFKIKEAEIKANPNLHDIEFVKAKH
jgi:N-acetyl-anhydromuramyl-L-alanine amidase AmpD